MARRAYCAERLQEIRTCPDLVTRNRKHHAGPILVTLDGVTNVKTQFLVTKLGRVTH